jgi:hypothetical protein
MWRLRPAVLRAAWWAWQSVRRLRHDLQVHGVNASVAPPPALTASASGGVSAVLDRLSPTCLERALVAQRWWASHDRPLDVLIGVHLRAGGPEGGGFAAHAWLDGSEPESVEHFQELCRIPAP